MPEERIGLHESATDAIALALREAPVGPNDVLVDLGSGLGKVVMLARTLTGATARGIEIQPALVERSRTAAERLGIEVTFTCGDIREANLDDGTVFYLYSPCAGKALAAVMDRLHAVARKHRIVVCALGVDLERFAPWLERRALDSFWLAIYDSAICASPNPVVIAAPP